MFIVGEREREREREKRADDGKPGKERLTGIIGITELERERERERK